MNGYHLRLIYGDARGNVGYENEDGLQGASSIHVYNFLAHRAPPGRRFWPYGMFLCSSRAQGRT